MSANTTLNLHNVRAVKCTRQVFHKRDDTENEFDVIRIDVTDIDNATIEIKLFTEPGFQLPVVVEEP